MSNHQSSIIKSRGLTQVEAGAILGIKQPHVSALMRNRRSFLHYKAVHDALHAGRIPRDLDRLLTRIQRVHRSAQVHCAAAGYHLDAGQIHFLIREKSTPRRLRQRFVLRSFRSRDFHGSLVSHHLTTQNERQNGQRSGERKLTGDFHSLLL